MTSELQNTLLQLDQINKELSDLLDKSSVFARYTIQYSKVYIEKKQGSSTKAPSDETAKSLTLSDPTMAEIIEQQADLKFRLDILLELSRNLRKKIDALRGQQEDEAATTERILR